MNLLRHFRGRGRRSLRRFFDILDAEGVGIFHAIVYLHIGLCAGLYGLLVAGATPQTVEDAMGSQSMRSGCGCAWRS